MKIYYDPWEYGVIDNFLSPERFKVIEDLAKIEFEKYKEVGFNTPRGKYTNFVKEDIIPEVNKDIINFQEHKEYKTLTDSMKKWTKESNERLWIPTILTLPIGMLYPDDVDNMVSHKTEMKWKFAPMVEILEEEKEKYPVEGQEGKFYERRIDTDNAIIYDSFLEGMSEVNRRLKETSKPKPTKVNLPKLKKVDGK